jgi:hypothetical protein
MMKMKRTSSLALIASLWMNGCTKKSPPADVDAETNTDAQASDVLSAPHHDEVAQYYGQGYDIPDELKTEEALRNGQLWAYLSRKRDAERAAYFEQNQAGYDAFVKAPMSLNGAPAVLFRLLPEVMPEFFSDANFERITGYYKLNPSDFLPYGFAYTKAPAVAGGAPSPLMVTVSCAACHTGRVQDESGQVKQILGGPSSVADINGYRSLLGQIVQNPNYTVEKFTAALLAKKDGELYGPDRIAEEKIDKAIFLGTPQSPAMGAALMQQFKDAFVKRGAYAAQTAGAYTFKNDQRLMYSSPGRVDFAAAVALAAAPVDEILADPAAGLQKYFPAAPGVGEIMSVWRQDQRAFAQWDGNLKNRLTRNLGAELGIAGDAKLVNFPNAVATTDFVEKMPAPAYPFKVDLRKAAEGRAIYEKACASCHESEKFIPLAVIGTEPGRASGLTKDMRPVAVATLNEACQDKSLPDCNVPDDDVVVPRENNPGYISVNLSGIWARAPYLHNGSVPTLYHLLVAEERPTEFQLNNFSYDEKWLGFQWRLNASDRDDDAGQNDPGQNSGKTPGKSGHVVRFDTRIQGYGNAGHSDIKVFNGGIDFRQDKRKLDALIEYMKTL